MFYLAVGELAVGEFRKKIMEFIPKYMVPTKHIRMEKFPLNANGKIDRLKLNQHLNG
jgi:acyl-coenzyme A synthetase/AMP-(fatty) acid ligase